MNFLHRFLGKGLAFAGLFAGLSVSANAARGIQAAIQFPLPVLVGSASQVLSVPVGIDLGGTIASVRVVTQGKTGGDFTIGSGGTCTIGLGLSLGQNCLLSVQFAPTAPGIRRGAVQVLDSAGNVLATQMLTGIGKGPAAVLIPPTIKTIAGNGTWVYRTDGVAAVDASIFLPGGIAVDGLGNVFLSDTSNNRVRRVDAATGMISTVAGTGTPGGSGDGGPATSAGVSLPSGMVIDGAGNLFFADSGNHAVRKLTLATGILSTVAGQVGQQGFAGDLGLATSALLNTPEGVALDVVGNLYIADTNNHAIRRVDALTGMITTVAGTGVAGSAGDGGSGRVAQLNSPWGITVDVLGAVYVADLGNNKVRRLSLGGTISTVVGTGSPTFNGDDQLATSANVKGPAAVIVDVAGNLYVADAGNNRVRKVAAGTGKISTVAGTGDATFNGDGGPATLAGMYGPYALTLDDTGNIFFSDIFHHRIRELQGTTAPLSYPAMRVGRTSSAQLITVENDGNDVLHFTALSPDSNSALDTAWTTCSTSAPMAVGITCVVGAQFTPQVTGNPASATIKLESDASNSPAVLTLSGEVDALEPTQTVLVSSQNPSALGAAVTFTATVSGGGTAPAGNVRFYDGTTLLATVATGAGSTAPFTTSTLTLGTHPVTANFTGDAENSPSTSAALNQVVKQTPTLLLSSSKNPSRVGETVTFTATVAGASVTATGSVLFYDGTAVIGNGTLDGSGVATFSTTALAFGTHQVTASYAGDASTLAGTTTAVAQVVNRWSTTTALTVDNGTPTIGNAVVLSVHVTTTSSVVPTGPITLTDGGVALATLTLDGTGNASYTSPGLAVGPHTLAAHFGGDATNDLSDSPALTETVQTISTTTALGSTVNPLSAGATTRLTATVTPASTNATAGVLFGSVNFVEGATTLGSAPITAAGVATLDVSTLAVGQHAIVAQYQGNTNYAASLSAALNQTVRLANTTVLLTTSTNPTIAGKGVTLTAVVSGDGGVPTGTMTFLDGATAIGTATVNGAGQASITLATLTTGTHTLTAFYSGDAKDATSTSNAIPEVVQQSITSIALTSSTNPSFAGATVIFTAALTSNGGLPSGTIVLHEGGTVLASAAMNGTGVASFSLNSLTAGSHTLTATFAGDADHSASDSGAIVQVVEIGSSTVALSTSKNPSVFGDMVTFAVNVTGTALQPTGTVSVMDGGATLATLTLNGGGVATFSTTALSIGDHALTAVYGGDTTHAGSTSRVLTERVQQATSVVLATSLNPSKVGDSIRLSATVTGASGVPITGSVSFGDGAAVVGVAQVNAGVASIDVSTLVAGTHLIVATYAGDATSVSSVSAALSQAVNTAGTSVTLVSSANPAVVGNAVTFTAAVVSAGKVPGGVVSFMEGSAVLGTGTVANGVASFTTTALTAGQHAVVARYGGDAGTDTSTSAALVQVMRQTTVAAIGSSLNPALTLQGIVLTATVGNGFRATGVVAFTDGSATLGSVALREDGTATLALPSLGAGNHTLAASYSGDIYNLPSTAPALVQVVQLRPTSMVTTAPSDTYLQGTQVTVVSVVAANGPVAPTGTVAFTSGGNSLGSAPVSTTGVATLAFFPVAKTYDIVATYSGDAVYAGTTAVKYTISEGAPTTFTMTPNVTAITLASGAHTSIDLTFTSVKGFTDILALGCLQLPPDVTCTFSSNKMELKANGTGLVHLVIDTGNPLGAGMTAKATEQGLFARRSRTLAAGLMLPGTLLLGLLIGFRKRFRMPPLLVLFLLLGVGAGLTGCANKLEQQATPAGSYTVRLVASGTQSGASRITDIPLTVTK